ncbi:protein SWEETIE [Sesamum angolense]|uniref:Protein SWEETIE n=1 Tax=Sesamum angolense TaxID=2727404 RepID=A0AAE1WHU1_9LAMI|nr:protein SWEETIE [Sesamum angolense]
MARNYVRDNIQLSRFGVLVAQLESIVASAAHKPPDPLLCFDLLSDLISAVDEEQKVSDSRARFLFFYACSRIELNVAVSSLPLVLDSSHCIEFSFPSGVLENVRNSYVKCPKSQESILLSQRKCEDALYSLLVLGARRPVRHLTSVAMAKVILNGDGISIYSRASSLQGFLADGKKSDAQKVAGL